MKINCFADCAGDACSCEEQRYQVITKYCSAIIAVQLIGVWLSGSFSLLSDTVHVAIDLTAALIAVQVARTVRKKGHNEQSARSFGAALHAALLAVAAWLIVQEGLEKLAHPKEIVSGYLIVAAVLGGYLNWRQHRILHMIPQKDNDTFWWMDIHILSDLSGNVAVIFASVVIFFTGYLPADSIASFAIAGLMFLALPVFIVRKVRQRLP